MMVAELEREYASKLSSLRETSGSAEIDALLLSDWKHVFYVTGFLPAITSRPGHLLIPREGEPVLLIHGMLEETVAREHSYVRERRTYYRPKDLFTETAKLLEQAGLDRSTVGVEMDSLSYSFGTELAKEMPGVRLVDGSPIVRKCRMVKTAREIRMLREASRITDEAVRGVLEDGIRPGISEVDVSRDLSKRFFGAGGDGASFPTIVLSGERAGLLSTRPSARVLQQGDSVLMDCGATYEGYMTDICRMASLGPPSEKLAAAYEVEHEALQEVIDAVKPGEKASRLYEIGMDVLERRGYRKFRRGERIGHGVGLDFHELPMVGDFDDTVLEPGMILCIEPTIQMTDLLVRIEDEVLVTESGCEILTTLPRELKVLT